MSTKNSRPKMLVLRTCNSDLTSYGGFQWPKKGRVAAKDWNPDPVCGGGLHGLPWGEGDGASLLDWSNDAKWLVIRPIGKVVEFGGKCKFRSGEVVFCGNRKGATEYIARHGGQHRAIAGCTATAGDEGTATAGDGGTATAGILGTATAGYRGTATAGDRGTATAGDLGTATAGDGGTATAGYGCTATAGDEGTATAGNRGTATAGIRGTATAGDEGTATAGNQGTATAGDEGTATAGIRGTATAGNRGTATAGDRGTATAGDRGMIQIKYWDGDGKRFRLKTGYIGERGLKAGVRYKIGPRNRFVAVKEA